MNDIMMAAISGGSLIGLVVTIIIIGVVYWVIDLTLTKIALPELFNKVARVVLILAAAVFLINALLTVAGHPLIRW